MTDTMTVNTTANDALTFKPLGAEPQLSNAEHLRLCANELPLIRLAIKLFNKHDDQSMTEWLAGISDADGDRVVEMAKSFVSIRDRHSAVVEMMDAITARIIVASERAEKGGDA